MSALKEAAKCVVPAPLWQGAANRSYRLRQALAWSCDPRGRESRRRIGLLRDRHRGQRCFILGNGPSLKKTDLSLLRHEITIGMNRVYLLFGELGFSTTYFASVNGLVLEQCGADIGALPCPKFLNWDMRDHVPFADDTLFLHTRRRPYFSRDLARGVWIGATVTYVAMQIAYHLGCAKVILIGVDHSFSTPGPPNQTVVSQGDDPNHFDPGYFGKGFRWQLPDLELSEVAYRMAREAFARDGREVVDATIGGKLEVFPKVDYYSLFEGASKR